MKGSSVNLFIAMFPNTGPISSTCFILSFQAIVLAKNIYAANLSYT